MSFMKLSKATLILSALLVLTSIILFIVPGPKLSIDFTGGTLMEITIPEEKEKADLELAVRSFATTPSIDYVTINRTKAGSYILRMRDLSNEEHLALQTHIAKEVGEMQEMQFTTIGPTVGATLKKRSVWALGIAAIAIVFYLAFAFRKVPRHLSPWKFGMVAVIALIHDVTITTGIFVVISHLTAFEFDTLFITALMTIIGYSVNDTIIIFDRIRDNLFLQEKREPFEQTVEQSLRQSLMRTANTSFSTIIMLSALFILGAESIRWFVLTLIMGIVIGTYSSIFLAAPLLVYWRSKRS
ncbi:MAG: protein translocase subunit SecF [Candidatus Peribacteraceae bacterium]|nr:protein translocase subunit SecF [Candidatus Peribacteraceae bacterium]